MCTATTAATTAMYNIKAAAVLIVAVFLAPFVIASWGDDLMSVNSGGLLSPITVFGIDQTLSANWSTLWTYPGDHNYDWETNQGPISVAASSASELTRAVLVCGVAVNYNVLCEEIHLNLDPTIPAHSTAHYRYATFGQVTIPTSIRGSYPSHGSIYIGRSIGHPTDEIRYGIITVGASTTQQAIAVAPTTCTDNDPDTCVDPKWRMAWIVRDVAVGYTAQLEIRALTPTGSWERTYLVFTSGSPDIPPVIGQLPLSREYPSGTLFEARARVMNPDGLPVAASIAFQLVANSQ